MPQMKLFGNSRSAARVAGKRKPDSEQAPKEKKQKKKKPLKVLAIWLTVILCLEGLYFFCCYTNNAFVAKWRTIYIQTAMSTMRHQWLATYLLPESVVDDVMRKRTESMEALGDKESSWGAKPEDTTPTAPEEPEVKPVDTAVTELPTETMTPEDEQALAKRSTNCSGSWTNRRWRRMLKKIHRFWITAGRTSTSTRQGLTTTARPFRRPWVSRSSPSTPKSRSCSCE